MRIYIPLTLDELPVNSNALALITSRAVHTATPELIAQLGTEDAEELAEYALLYASLESLVLLGARPQAPRQRAVLVMEVQDNLVAPAAAEHANPASGPSLRWLTQPVDLRQGDCLFVDEPHLEALVSQAVDTGKITQELIDSDLLWYDISEAETLAAK